MTSAQQRRLREVRSRVLVRTFDHRQRGHARGVWFRLRRVLAFASEAHVIPADEAKRLIAEGYRPEPVGQELEPRRVILLVPGSMGYRALQSLLLGQQSAAIELATSTALIAGGIVSGLLFAHLVVPSRKIL